MTSGVLYLVPTPIGNLEDMSPRAMRILTEVDRVAAEDTRVCQRLFQGLGLAPKPMLSYHAHNEKERLGQLLSYLSRGESIALVSDAGMPLISDPGEWLVRAVIDAGHALIALPGPSAALTALIASGLETRRFVFHGFLPKHGKARREALEALVQEPYTSILYEAPHRLEQLLTEAATLGLGKRLISVAHEMTKRYESHWRGSLEEVLERLATMPIRGEHVLVLEGQAAYQARHPGIEEAAVEAQAELLVRKALQEGIAAQEIRQMLQEHVGLSRNKAYALFLDLRDRQKEPS